MTSWMNLGHQVKMNAFRFPNKIAIRDNIRCFSYSEMNTRVNYLANGLNKLGLVKGDKLAVYMENSIELVEFYLATAKIGIIIVPINFRLHGKDVSYIINNSDAKLLCVSSEFSKRIDIIKKDIIKVLTFMVVGKPSKGYIDYDTFLFKNQFGFEPISNVGFKDPWIIIYTSGTTGKPKGVIRSHGSHISFYLINAIDFGFSGDDICMNIMPLCHINSVFFTFIFLYIGGSIYIHQAQGFRAIEVFKIIERERITFISLIPTHYSIIMNVPESDRKYDLSSVKKLLCSSAAVTKSMKMSIMEFFPGVQLYEAYGSSEAGIVTILKPEDQINKLGSIGYESLGTDMIKILDQNGKKVCSGEVGEIYSRGPMLFDGYYKMPMKTKASFIGEWFSAGDMGLKDKDGFYRIVDRKDNMIITGGEHVYPSEVEEVLSIHPYVLEVAVIGVFDKKWGEKVVAIVVLSSQCLIKDVSSNININLRSYCKQKLPGYKCPKDILYIEKEEMPRTTTGKILHRILRERFGLLFK